jgi:hypothetical protein
MARRAHGEESMYRSPDGYWHASINLATGLDGKRLRRHVQGRTQGEVRRKLDELKKARDARDDLVAPREPIVAEWGTCIELVERTCQPSTARTYRTHVAYLTPIRRLRLDKLTPEHIESIYVGAHGVTVANCRMTVANRRMARPRH